MREGQIWSPDVVARRSWTRPNLPSNVLCHVPSSDDRLYLWVVNSKYVSNVPSPMFVHFCNVWVNRIVYHMILILIIMSNLLPTVFPRALMLFTSAIACGVKESNVCRVVVSEFRRVVAGFSLHRPGLNPRLILVVFMVFEVTLEQVSIRFLHFYSASCHYTNKPYPYVIQRHL